MALFTDGAIASIEELRGHDTQLLNVATIEGIDVTRKLAVGAGGTRRRWQGCSGRPCLSGQLSRRRRSRQVVVTPPRLKLWHTFLTLELVYRDAYGSQLNDRYAGKRDEYHEHGEVGVRTGRPDRIGDCRTTR